MESSAAWGLSSLAAGSALFYGFQVLIEKQILLQYFAKQYLKYSAERRSYILTNVAKATWCMILTMRIAIHFSNGFSFDAIFWKCFGAANAATDVEETFP